VKILTPGDRALLDAVAPGVFDRPVDPSLGAEFLDDPRHHLAIGVEGGTVVGIASALHYVHPDKAPELWINEVGVAPAYRGQGLGRRLLEALLALGRELGCREAWALAEAETAGARRFYEAVGGRPSPCTMYSFDL